MKRLLYLFFAATIALGARAVEVRALDFDFAKIVDTNTPIPGGGGTAIFDTFAEPILDGYQVAFHGYDADPYYPVVGVSSGGVLTIVADTNTAIPGGTGNFESFGSYPSISGGNVAFKGSGGSGQSGVYTTVGGLSSVADMNTPIPGGVGNFQTELGRPSADENDVAFEGNIDEDAPDGIYSSAGGLHAVADTSTPMPNGPGNFVWFEYPSIDGGNVAFGGIAGAQRGIYIDVGGTLSVVADTTMPMPDGPGNFTQFGGPSFDNGNVAFRGWSGVEFSGIYTDVGGLHRVADVNTSVPGGGSFTQFGTPSLDNGSVVFFANGSSGQLGIFTNYGGSLSAVVTGSMQIDGKQLFGVYSERESFSNGNVAFRGFFSDGSQAIYVAEQSYDWAANTSGAWDTAGNWSFGLVPRSVVPTIIRPDYGVVLTGPAAPTTIRALNLGAVYGGIAELRLQPSGQLTVNQWLTVETHGQLNVNGGVATAVYGFDNSGEIDLGDGGQTSGGALYNYGTLRGSGTVGNVLYNSGRIRAIDSHIEFSAGVLNNDDGISRIDARNALLEFSGGLVNYGRVNFSFGTSDVFGDVQNLPGEISTGQIIVSGGAVVTFYDDVTQNGTLTVSKVGSTTSVAVFFGNATGNGAGGGGDIFYEGELHPGSSPALMTFDNNVSFGSAALLEIELGGTLRGDDYDSVNVLRQLTLGGTLEVELADDFMPVAGDSFDILDWSSRTGTFDEVRLPDLSGSLSWDTTQLYTTGLLAVVGGLLGDYNDDGIVDAADYTVWRDHLNEPGYELLNEDPNVTPGEVTEEDFGVWKSHFGQTSGGAGADAIASAVPEPAGAIVLVFATVGLIPLVRRRSQRNEKPLAEPGADGWRIALTPTLSQRERGVCYALFDCGCSLNSGFLPSTTSSLIT